MVFLFYSVLNASRRAKKEFLMQKGFSEKEVETAFSRVPTSQVLTQSEANDPSAGRNVCILELLLVRVLSCFSSGELACVCLRA